MQFINTLEHTAEVNQFSVTRVTPKVLRHSLEEENIFLNNVTFLQASPFFVQ